MFNIGSGEIALIAVVALLILGPSRLPELARGIGKFMREFRRQTDEVRGVVEREFYKMDSDIAAPPVKVLPAQDAVAKNPYPTPSEEEAMAAPEPIASQLTAGMPPLDSARGDRAQSAEPAPVAPHPDPLPLPTPSPPGALPAAHGEGEPTSKS